MTSSRHDGGKTRAPVPRGAGTDHAAAIGANLARADLKKASIGGLGINMSAQLARFAMQFAYQIAIARLLSPRDFGLVALTAPIIAFVQLFADLGLSQVTIQRAEISQKQLSLIFWINVAAGVGLAAITFALAPVVGWFYGDPRVIGVTMASGSLFILGGLYTQHLALLNRRMRFSSLAIIDLSSFLLGGTVGIVAALSHAGYWAIFANQAATSIVSLVLAWLLVRWRPSAPGRAEDTRALIKFGGDLTGFNLVNYFARNLDNVLIGRFAGEQSLGLYDRAYKLLLLPLTQISGPMSRVAVPMLSRTQNEPAVYRRAFIRTLETTLLLTYPSVLFALVMNRPLIETVLGPKWTGVAPIFGILAIGGLSAPIANATGWLFISQGRTREMRNTGLLSSALFVLSFIIGLPWGPTGVAASYILMGVLRTPFICRAATRSGPVSIRDLLAGLYPPAIAGAATLATIYAASRVLPSGLLELAVLFALAQTVFLMVMFALPRGRETIMDLAKQVAPILRRRRAAVRPSSN